MGIVLAVVSLVGIFGAVWLLGRIANYFSAYKDM
jgi:hypothetical protein